jgi:asparagine synthetase B (glutamine-hydrolysing)
LSGIFGLFDPAGADGAALRGAAARITHRGDPEVHADGQVALGAFIRLGDASPFVQRGSCRFVFDARVDGAVAGTLASQLESRYEGTDLMAALLESEGPKAFDGLAADFAVAQYDEKNERLVLSRDAFGLRPLFWGVRGTRVGFACEPGILVALGLAGWELNREQIAAFLAFRSLHGEHTAFRDVRRVLGGTWLSFAPGKAPRRGRWFRPEEVPESKESPGALAEELAEELTKAVASRSRGRPTGLLLSSGRDSGSVAVALARAGVSAHCMTYGFDEDFGCDEREPARLLAEALGHSWREIPVTSRPSRSDLIEAVTLTSSPLGPQGFPLGTAMRRGVTETQAQVILDGAGGDHLFAASPLAVLDLLRRGKISSAARASRAFHERWTYPYLRQVKTIGRALSPTWVLRLREQGREVPPWVVGPVPTAPSPLSAARTEHEFLATSLALAGTRWEGEVMERWFQPQGVEFASPLFDLRVVRLALSAPVTLRVPVPVPKPLLSHALLRRFGPSRRKMSYQLYFQRLGATLPVELPDLFDGSVSVREGYVRRIRPDELPEWSIGVLPLAYLEGWLRWGRGRSVL